MKPKNGNYDKYMSKNPLMRRANGRFLNTIASLVSHSGASTILDAGCGEEFLASHLKTGKITGLDVSRNSLRFARRMNPGMSFTRANV